jgi:hypothetical protein
MSGPADALVAAKEKNCDYLVTTNQTNSHVTGSVLTIGGSGTVNRQTYYVTVTYQLTKVRDGSQLSSGAIKTSDDLSEQDAVGAAMRKIAAKVAEGIKKAGPIAKYLGGF